MLSPSPARQSFEGEQHSSAQSSASSVTTDSSSPPHSHLHSTPSKTTFPETTTTTQTATVTKSFPFSAADSGSSTTAAALTTLTIPASPKDPDWNRIYEVLHAYDDAFQTPSSLDSAQPFSWLPFSSTTFAAFRRALEDPNSLPDSAPNRPRLVGIAAHAHDKARFEYTPLAAGSGSGSLHLRMPGALHESYRTSFTKLLEKEIRAGFARTFAGNQDQLQQWENELHDDGHKNFLLFMEDGWEEEGRKPKPKAAGNRGAQIGGQRGFVEGVTAVRHAQDPTILKCPDIQLSFLSDEDHRCRVVVEIGHTHKSSVADLRRYILGSEGQIRCVIYIDIEDMPAHAREQTKEKEYKLELSLFLKLPADKREEGYELQTIGPIEIPAEPATNGNDQVQLSLANIGSEFANDDSRITIPFTKLRSILALALKVQSKDDREGLKRKRIEEELQVEVDKDRLSPRSFTSDSRPTKDVRRKSRGLEHREKDETSTIDE